MRVILPREQLLTPSEFSMNGTLWQVPLASTFSHSANNTKSLPWSWPATASWLVDFVLILRWPSAFCFHQQDLVLKLSKLNFLHFSVFIMWICHPNRPLWTISFNEILSFHDNHYWWWDVQAITANNDWLRHIYHFYYAGYLFSTWAVWNAELAHLTLLEGGLRHSSDEIIRIKCKWSSFVWENELKIENRGSLTLYFGT